MARRENRDSLQAEIDSVLMTARTEEWINRLDGQVPAAPILTLAEALDNPYAEESGMIDCYEHSTAGPLRAIACPIRIDGKRPDSVAAPKIKRNNSRANGSATFKRPNFSYIS